VTLIDVNVNRAADNQQHNQKNRSETQAKLVKAVGEVLAERGFAKLGVNAVARQAGVDKVLIYRYFDDLDGLMQAYARSSDFWPSSIELLGDAEAREQLKTIPFAKAFAMVFRRYANALRSRPLTLEILSWETIERNALTIALEEVREAAALELMAFLSETNPPSADWQAIANIFSGAIHYLAIRSRKITVFSGMNIADDEGWERLITSIEFLVENLPTDNASKHVTTGN
jgi:AcrR family transcriptional regulator